jgi:hypothetical protein
VCARASVSICACGEHKTLKMCIYSSSSLDSSILSKRTKRFIEYRGCRSTISECVGSSTAGAAREADEMAALDAVGDYEADPNVMLEDVSQDIVIKTLKVSCAFVPVLVFACVCVYVRARDVVMCS